MIAKPTAPLSDRSLQNTRAHRIAAMSIALLANSVTVLSDAESEKALLDA